MCSIGILIAISIFFIHGIEEVPLPVGAIIFKAEGIAQSLLVFFVFTVPLIIYKHQNTIFESSYNQNKQESNSKSDSVKFTEPTTNEEWEEATIEDLQSGDFEFSDK